MEPDVNHVLSDAPHTITPQERDWKLVAELHEPLSRILYRSWQLHQLGAFDGLPFEQAPQHVRSAMFEAADIALASVSDLRRSDAERHAKLRIKQDIETWSYHYQATLPPSLTARTDAWMAARVITALLGHLEMAGIWPSWIWASEQALSQPLSMSTSAQVARAALGTITRSPRYGEASDRVLGEGRR